MLVENGVRLAIGVLELHLHDRCGGAHLVQEMPRALQGGNDEDGSKGCDFGRKGEAQPSGEMLHQPA